MNAKFIIAYLLVILVVCFQSVNSFNVPPTGMCFVGSGGDCYRCDCAKPLSCYKGSCR